MEVDSELHVPRRRGRGKTTRRSPNPLTRSSRNSNIENSPSLETTREILWKCVFCQKVFLLRACELYQIPLLDSFILQGFTYSSSYRDRHEMRCPNRNHQNGTSADSFVQSTLASSLMHGKNKRFNKNSLKCDVCAVVTFCSYFVNLIQIFLNDPDLIVGIRPKTSPSSPHAEA